MYKTTESKTIVHFQTMDLSVLMSHVHTQHIRMLFLCSSTKYADY